MSLNSFLEMLINRTIQVFFYWLFNNAYILLIQIAAFFGISCIFFNDCWFVTDFIGGLRNWSVFLAAVFLWFISGGFLWIFTFWMGIIMFVPYVIIIPIPIIPFIIPIPLKTVILEFVPPFKILTDRGILPFMRKIIFRFLYSEDIIKDRFKFALFDTYNFLYDEIKLILGDIFKNVMPKQEPQNISKGIQDDEYEVTIETDEDSTEEKAEEQKTTENKNIQDLINEELQVCLKSKQGFISSDMSSIEALYSNMGNMNNYADCYATSIKAYIDNKL